MTRNPTPALEKTTETGCCGGGRCEHGDRETRKPPASPTEPQRVELSLEGLSAAAMEAAARALRATEGVTEVLLNPITARAVLEFRPAQARVGELVGLLEARGAVASDRIVRWHVPLPGIACGRCATRIEEEVGHLPGVHGAIVNRAAESLTVEYTPSKTALEPVRDSLASRGFHTATGAPPTPAHVP